MPYCTKCGSPVGYEKFCSKCGAAVNAEIPPPPQFNSHSAFPIKPSTNLANGITLGVGSASLIVGLIIAFALNGIYAEQTNYLAAQGVQVNTYAFGFSNLAFLISMGAYIAIFGIYMLILGALNQFSPKVRTAMQRKDGRALIGGGLLTGGFVFSAISALNIIDHTYFPYHGGGFELVDIVFTGSGLIVIFIGVLLIRSSYLQSLRATKV